VSDDDGITVESIATRFPGWGVDPVPGDLDVWSAYWQSEDGRERRVITAGSAGELLARLRTVTQVTA
jgi:hypothetical protein